MEQCTVLFADLSKTDEAAAFIEKVNEIGDIDILVNNLGFFEVKDFADVTDEEWNQYFEVNVMSAVRTSRHFLPKMLAKNSGRILNIASEAGVKPPPTMIPYSMTKTALISLSRGMAEMTKGTNVTVNSVLPGPTWTEGVASYMEGAAQANRPGYRHIYQRLFQGQRANLTYSAIRDSRRSR
nr:SDR family NAD(P)-dependent oxidoreductase [Bacillus subtilis]